MAESMYLDGRDDGNTAPRLDQLNSSQKLPRIFLCIVDEQDCFHRTVVPLPTSYEATANLAVETLGKHMVDPNIAIKDVDLRYGNSLGSTSPQMLELWSIISPRFWTQIVVDGDELRVFHTRKELHPTNFNPDGTPPAPIERPIVAVLVYWKASATGNEKVIHKEMVTLKDTYQDTVSMMIPRYSSLIKKKEMESWHIHLTLRAQDAERNWLNVSFQKVQWKQVIRSLREDGIAFEVHVRLN